MENKQRKKRNAKTLFFAFHFVLICILFALFLRLSHLVELLSAVIFID